MPTYQPESNGLVERLHRDLKSAIKCKISSEKSQWSHALPWVLLAHRNTPRRDTETSPAEMVFGTTCSLPFDLISEDSPAGRTKLTKRVRWLNATRESFVSKMRHAGHPEIFVPKDLQTAHHVYVRADRITDGLSPKWDGPYKVVKRGEHTFTLALGLDELGQKRNEDIALRGLKPAYYDESGRPESLPVRNVPGRNPAKPRTLTAPEQPPTPATLLVTQESTEPPAVPTYAQAAASQKASPIMTTTTRSGRVVKHVVDRATTR